MKSNPNIKKKTITRCYNLWQKSIDLRCKASAKDFWQFSTVRSLCVNLKTITSFQTSKMMKEKQNRFKKWQEPQQYRKVAYI